jgi:predicted ATP-grasp superfamily ATP-dependent carboligase
MQRGALATSAAQSGAKTPGALIVGGAHVSIGVARSLGRQGIPVWLLANHPIAKFTRYVQRRFDWPGADHPDGVSSIMDLATRHGLDGWVLIATGDQDVRMIAQNHALLSTHYRVATPNWETIQWTYDKRLTYQRAAALGIDYPRSYQPKTSDEAARLECRFPVILKPAFRKGADEFTQAKAWKADDRAALTALYEKASALVGGDAVIVQEWIPGTGSAQFSYAGLWDHGRPVASLVARRTRQHPIDFGRSSTFVESTEQPEVEALAGRFLKSFDYTGVVEVEFKYDARERQYKLLDVNGRFWTWCGLGSLAGVDFPYLAWRQAMGLTVEPCRVKPGAAWMHASRDIVAAWQEMSGGTLTFADYLKSFRKPLAFANFALDDPLPALVEFPVAVINRIASAAHDTLPAASSHGWRSALDKLGLTPRRIAK